MKLFLSRVFLMDQKKLRGSQSNAPVPPGMLATALASSRSTFGPSRGRHGAASFSSRAAAPASFASRPLPGSRPLAPRKPTATRPAGTSTSEPRPSSRKSSAAAIHRAASTRRRPRCRYSRTRARLSARHLRRARPSLGARRARARTELRRSPGALRPRPDRRKRVRKAERRFRPRRERLAGDIEKGAGRRGDTLRQVRGREARRRRPSRRAGKARGGEKNEEGRKGWNETTDGPRPATAEPAPASHDGHVRGGEEEVRGLHRPPGGSVAAAHAKASRRQKVRLQVMLRICSQQLRAYVYALSSLSAGTGTIQTSPRSAVRTTPRRPTTRRRCSRSTTHPTPRSTT